MKCLNARDKDMKDPTENEKAAMVQAGINGGEYLDEIKKTDLAKMSDEEWNTFVEAIVTGYIEEMQRRNSMDAPF